MGIFVIACVLYQEMLRITSDIAFFRSEIPFLSFDETAKMEREDLLAEMTHFAKLYEQAMKGKTGDERLDR